MSAFTSSHRSSHSQDLVDKRSLLRPSSASPPLAHIHFPPSDRSSLGTNANAHPGDEEGQALLDGEKDLENDKPPSPSLSRQRRTSSLPVAPENDFSSIKFAAQALPCLLLSIVGGTLTGELLEAAHTWPAFIRVPELYILLPILMNLKGNLEMNLTARLSTSANVGDLDKPSHRRQLVWGNLTLLQVQALIVSFFASLMAFVLGLLSRNHLPIINHIPLKPGKLNGPGWNTGLRGGYFECLLVLSAGMLAASVNSAVLGGLMCGLIVLCRQWSINPDNISTPIAASLGDLLTLCFLGLASSALIKYAHTFTSTIVFVALLVTIVISFIATLRNRFVQEFLRIGWVPLFAAMIVSTCTGLLMERFVKAFDGYAIVVLLITGLTGNIGTILLSRTSTALHARTSEPSLRVAGILICLALAILLASVTYSGKRGYVELSAPFFIGFTLVAILSSAFSLALAHVLCHRLWALGYNPDVYAIPLLTSLVDLVTQLLLSSTFSALQFFSS